MKTEIKMLLCGVVLPALFFCIWVLNPGITYFQLGIVLFGIVFCGALIFFSFWAARSSREDSNDSHPLHPTLRLLIGVTCVACGTVSLVYYVCILFGYLVPIWLGFSPNILSKLPVWIPIKVRRSYTIGAIDYHDPYVALTVLVFLTPILVWYLHFVVKNRRSLTRRWSQLR
jgi:hypothetical protein